MSKRQPRIDWRSKRDIKEIKALPKNTRDMELYVRRAALKSINSDTNAFCAIAIVGIIVVAGVLYYIASDLGDDGQINHSILPWNEPAKANGLDDLVGDIGEEAFQNTWALLNGTDLDPRNANSTDMLLGSAIANYTVLARKADKIAGEIDENKLIRFNRYINENISATNHYFDKQGNLTEQEISELQQLETNLTNLNETVTAYLAERGKDIRDLNDTIEKLKIWGQFIKEYRKDFDKHTKNYVDKTRDRDIYVARLNTSKKLKYAECTIKGIYMNHSRFLDNLTKIENKLDSFEPIGADVLETDSFGSKLYHKLEVIRDYTSNITRTVRDWYNSSKTTALDKDTFSARYDTLTPEQQEIFLNRTQKGELTDEILTNGEINKVYIIRPNDPNEEHKAEIEDVDGTKKRIAYHPDKVPEIRNIFDRLLGN